MLDLSAKLLNKVCWCELGSFYCAYVELGSTDAGIKLTAAKFHYFAPPRLFEGVDSRHSTFEQIVPMHDTLIPVVLVLDEEEWWRRLMTKEFIACNPFRNAIMFQSCELSDVLGVDADSAVFPHRVFAGSIDSSSMAAWAARGL